MGRPRTPVGTFGEIWLADLDNGSVEARTWYRDDDGKSRQVRATGPTDTAAKIALKAAIATRGTRSGFGDLTRNSSFTDLVDLWLEDLDLEDAIAESTRALYERNMRQLVMPAFENFTLRECTVGRVDRFLKSVAKNGSPSMAKQAKTVLSLAFGLAVRYEALPSNPVRDTKRIKKADTETVALTLDQIHAIDREVLDPPGRAALSSGHQQHASEPRRWSSRPRRSTPRSRSSRP